jgi:formamidopyrimidine-DNA glycosylase
MRIAVSGKGTYKARQTLKSHKLRWIREKHAWMGDVDRLTVTLIREYMKQIPNILLTFENSEEELEYYGSPRWICPKCGNVIRREECWFDGKVTYKCMFCQAPCRLLEE